MLYEVITELYVHNRTDDLNDDTFTHVKSSKAWKPLPYTAAAPETISVSSWVIAA